MYHRIQHDQNYPKVKTHQLPMDNKLNLTVKYGLAILALILLLVLSALKMQAQTAFTLDAALQYAMENNHNIQNAQLDVKASEKKVWETTAIGLPQASVKASYQNIFKVPEMNFGPDPIQLGVKENITTDFTVSQLIFNGSYIVGLQASRTYKDLSTKALVKTEQEIKEVVTNLYYLCLINDERVKNLQVSYEEQLKVRNEIQAMADQGFMQQTDVDQMTIIVNNLDIAVRSINRQSDIFKQQLKIQMGLNIDAQMDLDGELSDIVSQIKLESNGLAFNASTNIDYQLMNTQVRLSDLNLKNTKAEFLPVISAFYNRQDKLKDPDLDFSFPDMLGVNFEMPLFSSGMKLAKVSQAKIELDKMQNDQWQLNQNLELSFLQTRSDYLSAFDQFENEKQNLELAKKIFDQMAIKYKEGVSSSMDLSNAQNQYINAQNQYYDAVYQLLSSKVKLNKITGKI